MGSRSGRCASFLGSVGLMIQTLIGFQSGALTRRKPEGLLAYITPGERSVTRGGGNSPRSPNPEAGSTSDGAVGVGYLPWAALRLPTVKHGVVPCGTYGLKRPSIL